MHKLNKLNKEHPNTLLREITCFPHPRYSSFYIPSYFNRNSCLTFPITVKIYCSMKIRLICSTETAGGNSGRWNLITGFGKEGMSF